MPKGFYDEDLGKPGTTKLKNIDLAYTITYFV